MKSVVYYLKSKNRISLLRIFMPLALLIQVYSYCQGNVKYMIIFEYPSNLNGSFNIKGNNQITCISISNSDDTSFTFSDSLKYKRGYDPNYITDIVQISGGGTEIIKPHSKMDGYCYLTVLSDYKITEFTFTERINESPGYRNFTYSLLDDYYYNITGWTSMNTHNSTLYFRCTYWVENNISITSNVCGSNLYLLNSLTYSIKEKDKTIDIKPYVILETKMSNTIIYNNYYNGENIRANFKDSTSVKVTFFYKLCSNTGITAMPVSIANSSYYENFIRATITTSQPRCSGDKGIITILVDYPNSDLDTIRYNLYKWVDEKNITYIERGHFFRTTTIDGITGATSYGLKLWCTNYCQEIFSGIQILPAPPALNINAVFDSATCAAKNDGSISIRPSGGTAPYNLEVKKNFHEYSSTDNTKITEFSFKAENTGNALVKIVTHHPEQHNNTITVFKNDEVYFIYDGDTYNRSEYEFIISLTKNNNYKITFTSTTSYDSISLKVFEYFNSITNISENSSRNISNLYAGEYKLRLTDNNGCVKDSTVNLATATINASYSVGHPTCSSLNNGSISVNKGTTRSLDLYFNGAKVSYTSFSNLPSGHYSIRLQNSDTTCVFLDTTITLSYQKEPQLSMYTFTTNSKICSNSNTGTIQVNKKAIGYNIAGIILNDSLYNSSSLAGMPAGAYKIKVKTTDNCITANDTTITIESYPPLVINATPEPVKCYGEANGSLRFNNPSGGAGKKYYLNMPDLNIFRKEIYKNDTTVGSLRANLYKYIISDTIGCTSDTLTVTVSQPNQLSLEFKPDTFAGGYHVPCAGDKYGSVTLQASGGNGSYSYEMQVDNNTISQNESNFNSIEINKKHTFTVRDYKGCSVTDTITLNSIPQPLVFSEFILSSYYGTNIRCYGDSSGKIFLKIKGGVSPYHLSIVPNIGEIHGTDSITNLTAGTYTVTIIDANGCRRDTTVTLVQPDSVTLVVNPIEYHGYHIPCNGDNVTISAEAGGGIIPYLYTWDAEGASEDSLHSLGSGWHTVKVTDTNGCFRIDTFELTQPDQLSVTIDSIGLPTCWYDSSGYIAVSVSGGISVDTLKYELYTHSFRSLWVNQNLKQRNFVFDNLPGRADYGVRVTDLNGCIASISPIDIIQHDTIQLQVLDIDSVSCNGGDNGQITVSARRSNSAVYLGDFSFYLDSVLKQAPADTLFLYAYDRLSAGFYQVTVKDKNNCHVDTIVTVPQPSKMELMPDIVPNICYGDNKASLTITAKGGVGGYKFAYAVLSTDTDSLTPSDHHFWVTRPDNVLKLDSLNWNVTHREDPQYFFIYVKDRNYVEGQSACIVSTVVTLPRKMPIKDTLIYHSPWCYGQSDGDANIRIIGGGNGNPETWTYSWKDSKGDEISREKAIFNLPSGRYTVWVKDSLGCSLERSFVLQEPGILTTTVASTTPYSFTSKTGGTATLIVQLPDNISTYRYALDTLSMRDAGGELLSLQNLLAGRHSIRFSYNNDLCQAIDSFDIAYAHLYIDTVYRGAAGKGASNGYARVVAKEGDGNYSYLWYRDNGSTYELLPYQGREVSSLAAGRYGVRVIDGQKDTSNIVEFAIEETEQFKIILRETQPATCTTALDGLAIVSVGGARLYPPYQFEWKNERNQVIGHDSVLMAGQGKYVIKVIDASGSVDSMNVTIGVRAPITINGSYSTRTTCYGNADGRITVISAGGSGKYHFTMGEDVVRDVSSYTFRNLSAGNYTVVISDAMNMGCQVSETFEVKQPNPIRTNSLVVTPPKCYGGKDGSISASAVGGNGNYTYSWRSVTRNDGLFTGLAAGTDTLKITDVNKCFFDTIIHISQPLRIRIGSSTLTPPSCYGSNDGKISLSLVNGKSPYMVQWEDGTVNLVRTGIKAGTYRVKITDDNGCVATDSVVLSQPLALSIDSVVLVDPTCFYDNNGKIELSVSGGTQPYSYNWVGYRVNAPVLQNISKGKYSVGIRDKNNCTISQNYILKSPPLLDFTISGQMPKCKGQFNGIIQINAVGGTPPYRYWLGNNETSDLITGLYANSYNLSVTDSLGCTAQKSYRLGEPTALIAKYTLLTDIKCAGNCEASVRIEPSGGTSPYVVQWPDNSTTRIKANLCAGGYNVLVMDSNQCKYPLSITIKQPNAIQMVSYLAVPPTCYLGNDGYATAVFSGGTGKITKLWNTGVYADTVYGLRAGEYTVTAIDSNNCKKTEKINVPEQVKESISGISPYYRVCTGQEVSLNPGLWRTYMWYKGDTLVSTDRLFTFNRGGTYRLKVVSPKGCTDSLSFTVEYVKDLIQADFLIPNDAVVNNEIQIIDVSWPIPETISWRYNQDSVLLLENKEDRQRIAFLYPGQYPVQLVAQTGMCTDSVTKYIVVFASDDDQKRGLLPVEPEKDILQLAVYPNPNKGEFNFMIKLKEIMNFTLDIYQIATGKAIYHKMYNNTDYIEETINIGYQSPGAYNLVIKTNQQVEHYLFIIL